VKVIGMVGSRTRDTDADYLLARDAFFEIYEEGDTLVSGGCPQGGDRFAERIADVHMVPITIHKPNWNKYGRSAGFNRNGLIARDADVLIAVVAEDRKGGTEDTIRKFKKLHPEGEVILV
jgi:hypothetical protein